jgi:hypothetical protein
MSKQDYRIGQHVRVWESSLSGPVTTGEFEIMGIYSVEACKLMYYRLRSIRGRDERVVPESEIIAQESPKAIRTAAAVSLEA